jgi:hypothetical protein
MTRVPIYVGFEELRLQLILALPAAAATPTALVDWEE